MRELKINLFLFSLILFFAACETKTPAPVVVEEEKTVEEYPVVVITDSVHGALNQRLYTLQPDFIQRLVAHINDYEGTKRIMQVPVPTEWGLIAVERLPQGRELWLVQSQDREWTYLVITSGAGTQRILDLTPIGLDLASDAGDVLEREVWNWQRDDDGSFVVEKIYDWKKSIAEATTGDPNDYMKKNYAIDRYVVDATGSFECFAENLQDTTPYCAVVFYYHPDADLSEWEEKAEVIEAFCEENAICYTRVNEAFHAVPIQDYRMNNVATIDITPQISLDSVGMILYQNGKEPYVLPDRGVEYLQMEIRKYFK